MKSLWNIEINSTRLILLLALLCTVLAAGIFRSSATIFVASTLIAAPFIVWLMRRVSSRHLKVTRLLPDRVMVGDIVSIHLSVSNAGWLPVFLVYLRPVVAPDFRLRRADKAGGGGVIPPYQLAEGTEELIVPVLKPHATFEGEIRWKMTRRGIYEMPGAGAGALDPLGLAESFPARSAVQKITVLPRPVALPQIAIAGGIEGEPQPRRGGSVAEATDLHGVRPYRAGEAIRRIHWKATARTRQLHVVEWEEEMASDLVVLIDVDASMNFGPDGDDTFEACVVAAASIAARLLDQGRRVRIFWWKPDATTPFGIRLDGVEARHQGGQVRVLEALAKLEAHSAPRATLVELSQAVRAQVGQGETALLLASDRVDVAAALKVWGHNSGARALLFDADSFVSQTSGARKTKAESSHRFFSGRATIWPRSTSNKDVTSVAQGMSRSSTNVRVVRYGESLATAFEKGWR